MKKIYHTIFIVLLVLNIAVCANAVEPKFFMRKKFTYLIAWNGIPIGSIYAENTGIINYKTYSVYVVRITTESNKFLSKIYRVEDIYTSYVDVQTMTSRRYEADRKEGRYKKHVIVEYDFDSSEAIYTSLTDGSVKRWPIEKNVQDPVSAMCYFLCLAVKPGEKLSLTVNLNEKNYKMHGEVGEVEAVKVPHLGVFPAYKVKPYAMLEGKMVKKGRAWMYFAAEKQRYPLCGVVLIPFGKVTAMLKKVEDI